MSKVDYCITTVKRPGAIERLLVSIAEHTPEASVHVAVQGGDTPVGDNRLVERLRRAGLRNDPTFHPLPFDCGVSAARNHLVASTPGEYKLILDDDFVFTCDTDVEAMARLLDACPEAGAVGGCVVREGDVSNVGTEFYKRESSLCQVAARGPLAERAGVRFKRVDCVPNFVLIRQSVFGNIRWDPALKTSAEHFDFFLRLRETSHAVLYVPDVAIEHPPVQAEAGYERLRRRGEFVKRMLIKHNAVRLKALNGTITELHSDGHLIGYCELKRHSVSPEEQCGARLGR